MGDMPYMTLDSPDVRGMNMGQTVILVAPGTQYDNKEATFFTFQNNHILFAYEDTLLTCALADNKYGIEGILVPSETPKKETIAPISTESADAFEELDLEADFIDLGVVNEYKARSYLSRDYTYEETIQSLADSLLLLDQSIDKTRRPTVAECERAERISRRIMMEVIQRQLYKDGVPVPGSTQTEINYRPQLSLVLDGHYDATMIRPIVFDMKKKYVDPAKESDLINYSTGRLDGEGMTFDKTQHYLSVQDELRTVNELNHLYARTSLKSAEDVGTYYIDWIDYNRLMIQGGEYYYDDPKNPDNSGNRTIKSVTRPFLAPKEDLIDISFALQPIYDRTAAVRYYGLGKGIEHRVLDGAMTIVEDQLDDQLISEGRGRYGRIKTAVGTIRSNAHLFGGFDKTSDFNRSISKPPIKVPIVNGETAYVAGFYVNKAVNSNRTLWPIYVDRSPTNPSYSKTRQYSHYGHNLVTFLRADYRSTQSYENIQKALFRQYNTIDDKRLVEIDPDAHNIVLLDNQRRKQLTVEDWESAITAFLPTITEIVDLVGDELDAANNFNDMNLALSPYNVSIADFTAEHLSATNIRTRLGRRIQSWYKWRKQQQQSYLNACDDNDASRCLYFASLRNLLASKGSLMGKTIVYDRFTGDYNDMIMRLIPFLANRFENIVHNNSYATPNEVRGFAGEFLRIKDIRELSDKQIYERLATYFIKNYDVASFHNKLNSILIDQVDYVEPEISEQIDKYLHLNNIGVIRFNRPPIHCNIRDLELVDLLNQLRRTADVGYELFKNSLFRAYQLEHKEYIEGVLDEFAKTEYKKHHGSDASWDGLSSQDKVKYMPQNILIDNRFMLNNYEYGYKTILEIIKKYHKLSNDIPIVKIYRSKAELEADEGTTILHDEEFDTSDFDYKMVRRYLTRTPIEMNSPDYDKLMSIFKNLYIFLTEDQIKKKLDHAVFLVNNERSGEEDKKFIIRQIMRDYETKSHIKFRVDYEGGIEYNKKTGSNEGWDALPIGKKIAMVPEAVLEKIIEDYDWVRYQRRVEPGDIVLVNEGNNRFLFRRTASKKWEAMVRKDIEQLPKLPYEVEFLSHSWADLFKLGLEDYNYRTDDKATIIQVGDKERVVPRGLIDLILDVKARNEIMKPLKAIVDFYNNYQISMEITHFDNMEALNYRKKEYLGVNKKRTTVDSEAQRVPDTLMDELAVIRAIEDFDNRQTELRSFISRYGRTSAPIPDADGDRPDFYFWNVPDLNIPLVCKHHDDLYIVATGNDIERQAKMERCIKKWGRVDGGRIICRNCGERISNIDLSDFEGFGKDDRVIRFREVVREEDEYDYKIDEIDVVAAPDNIIEDNEDELRAEQILDNVCYNLGIHLTRSDRQLFFDQYITRAQDLPSIDGFYRSWLKNTPYLVLKSRFTPGCLAGEDAFDKIYANKGGLTLRNIKQSLSLPDRAVLQPFTDNFLSREGKPGIFYLSWLGYRYYRKLELVFAVLLAVLRVSEYDYDFKGTGAERRGRTGGIKMRDPFEYPNDAVIQLVDIEMRVVKTSLEMKKKAIESKKKTVTQAQNMFDNINNYLVIIKKATTEKEKDKDDKEIAEKLRSDLSTLHTMIINTPVFRELLAKKEIVVNQRKLVVESIVERYRWPEFLPSMYLQPGPLPSMPSEIEVTELIEVAKKAPTPEHIIALRALSKRLAELLMLQVYNIVRKTDDIKTQTLSYLLICCASPVGGRYLDYFAERSPEIKSTMALQRLIQRAFEDIGYTASYSVISHIYPNEGARRLLGEYGREYEVAEGPVSYPDMVAIKTEFPSIARTYDELHRDIEKTLVDICVEIGLVKPADTMKMAGDAISRRLQDINIKDLVEKDLLIERIRELVDYLLRRTRSTDVWREYVAEQEITMSRELIVERILPSSMEEEKRYRRFLLEQNNSLIRRQTILDLIETISMTVSSVLWRQPLSVPEKGKGRGKRRNVYRETLVQQLTSKDELRNALREFVNKLRARSDIELDSRLKDSLTNTMSRVNRIQLAVAFMNESGKLYNERLELNHITNELLVILLLDLLGICGDIGKTLKRVKLDTDFARIIETILKDFKLYYNMVFVRDHTIAEVMKRVRDQGNKNRKERYVQLSDELQAIYKVTRGYGLGNEFKGFDDELIDAPEDVALVSQVAEDPFAAFTAVGREGGMEQDGDDGNDGNLDDDAEEGEE